MQKTILLISFIFLNYSFCFGQEINKILDDKNGFKDFKIGDDFSKWQNQSEEISLNLNGNYYKYIGDCCKNVFNTELLEIILFFKNNKLEEIILTTPIKISDTLLAMGPDYYSLKSNFEEIFKQKSNTFKGEKPGDFVCGWRGENIILFLTAENLGLKYINDVDRYKERYRCVISISKKTSLENGF